MSEVTVKDAAKERAWRTFLPNLWIDLCVIVGPLVYDMIFNVDGLGTKEYWILNGLSVGKTTLLVIISYVMRLKYRPTTEIVR